MILQALNDYYQRKSAADDAALAPFGFELKELPFILVLDRQGELIDIEDTRTQVGKKAVGGQYKVPQGVKKTSGIAANLLWDNAEYVLGIDTRGKPDRVAQQHAAFVERIKQDLADLDDPGLNATRTFLESLDLADLERFSCWEEIREANPNMSFKLNGQNGLICQQADIIEALERHPAGDSVASCSVTGNAENIARLHPAIKGVWGAQTAGANIISFNLDAFTSFGKEQGNNAPVGEKTAFAYTTALNHLLRRDSPQRMQIGDASAVFWADRESGFADGFGALFNEPPKDDPDLNTVKVRSLLNAVNTGGYTEEDADARFFLLGLAPNAARIAIRFWEHGTVAEIAPRIAQHFRDIEMVTNFQKDQPHPTNFRLLANIAAQGKADNIPPNLGGEFMRAILNGTPYPATLWQAAVRRNRAEQNVTYYRAALLKGCLNRLQRRQPFMEKEITVSLDLENPNTGYRLGRLFAVLEKIQQEAQGNINATIRDKFYGSASASPLSVFSNLMKLKNHHLSKMDNKGRVSNLEKLIGEIVDDIKEFPAQLPLRDQGLFALGYYHQRTDLYTKKQDKE